MEIFVSAIIPAGGTGSRMKLDIPKQFYRLGGKTILEHSVRPFDDSPLINEIIVVTLPEYIECCRNELNWANKPVKFACGGETRQASVYNGLVKADPRATIVVVHDGARPLVTNKEIEDVINCTRLNGCASVIGTRISETVKLVNAEGFVEQTPKRESLRAVQTPQSIPRNLFIEAYKKADETGFSATDDVSLAEFLGCPVKVIEGSTNNIKITCNRDLLLAEMLLNQ